MIFLIQNQLIPLETYIKDLKKAEKFN